MEGSDLSQHPLRFGGAVIGLLIVDIGLPIPSSVVCTLAGGVFGSFTGTLVCWLGLNLSALTGYLLAKYIGPTLTSRLTSPEQLKETAQLVDRLGPWALALCRAVPLLAEASVLYAGLYQMNVRKFWPPILGANLGIAIAYCVLGDLASQQEWIAVALAISISVPVLVMVSWIWVVRKKGASP